MKHLEIDFKIPEGRIINDYDSNYLVNELGEEINYFVKAISSDDKSVEPEIKKSKTAQGGIEFAQWLINLIDFIEEHPETTKMVSEFIKHIWLWASIKLIAKSKKGKKTEEAKEDPKIIIKIGNNKIELPTSKEAIEEFISNIKKK